MGQVVEGEFWLHNEGATDKGTKINVVYVVEKGQPLVSPAP